MTGVGRLGRLALGLLALSSCHGRDKPPGEEAHIAGVRPQRADDLVYFVFVDRFANGDPTNDEDADPSDPQAWHGGDLEGVIQRLDHLAELGVKTLWLSPIFLCQDEKFYGWGAFHGYWVRDLRQIDPRFGDETTLKRLSDAAERRGMRLVLDVVYNHTSFDATALTEHPNWYNPALTIEDWNDPEQLVNRQVHGLPDLNQQNPEVYAYLRDATLQWALGFGVDGLRIDAVRHMPTDFFARLHEDLRGAAPGLWTLGEDFQGDPRLLAATFAGGGFDAMFDFPLRYALIDSLCRDTHLGRLGSVLSSDRLYQHPEDLVTFLDNHDMPRVLTECGGDRDAVRRAWVTQMALRGVPALTWGAELHLEGGEEPDNRRDMPWDRVGEVDPTLKALIQLREANPWLRDAPSQVLRVDEAGLTVLRVGPESVALLELNLSETERPSDQLGPGPWSGISSTGAGCAGPVPPHSARVCVGSMPGEVLASLTTRVLNPAPTRLTLRVPDPQEGLIVVGSAPELGAWSPEAGVPLTPDPAGGVSATIVAPAGTVFAYKLVRRGPDGAVTWEERGDRYALLNEDAMVEAYWAR